MGDGVSNRQIFFIIFLVVSGFSVIQLPMDMAKSAGTGAWIPLLITAIFFAIFTAIIIYLNYRYKGQTLFEYSSYLVGKPITYLFTGIYLLYFLGVTSMLLRLICELFKVDLLPKTPIFAMLFIIIIVCAYAASKGLTNVGRIAEFFGLVLIIFYIAVIPIMFLTGDFLNNLPLFNGKEIPSYIKALPLTIMPFLGIEVLTVFPLRKENGKKAFLYSIGSVFAVGVLYILLVYGTYMKLGVEDTKFYNDALLINMRRLDVAVLQFFQRLDRFAVVSWIFSMFCTHMVLFYVLVQFSSKIFKKTKPNLLLFLLSVGVFIIAMLPNTNETAGETFKIIAIFIGPITAFLIPFILFVVSKIRDRKEKEREQERTQKG